LVKKFCYKHYFYAIVADPVANNAIIMIRIIKQQHEHEQHITHPAIAAPVALEQSFVVSSVVDASVLDDEPIIYVY
jgi:hypothetical protein